MSSFNLSAPRLRRGLLPAIVLALFLLLATRPGPPAALGSAPPGLPPQVLEAASNHTCALRDGGAIDCWGDDFFGQAADMPGPYTQVTNGTVHTCALTPAGAVDCWGANGQGQTVNMPGPYTQISAGSYHTCALTPTGAADCWGDNASGQAADMPGPYTQLSAGANHTCGLTPTGAADCWGANFSGQADDQPGPYTQVSAGDFPNCALTVYGAADCWGNGNNEFGAADDQTGPYVQVSAGSYHTCALTVLGAADCWGWDSLGQATDQTGPYSWISAGYHTCALTPTGAADCWGFDGSGQATDQTGPYRPNEPNEPNDTSGTATSLNYDETIRNNYIGVAGDVDRYSFYGLAGQRFIVEVKAETIGSGLDSLLTLYDTDGATVINWNNDFGGLDSRLDITIPATGTYYLSVEVGGGFIGGGPRHFYDLSIHGYSHYVSATKNGTVGGVAATPQDILRYDTNLGIWMMWLDGSDVGITKALSAFARLPGGDWLLVFKSNQTTPAGTFTPCDIARFTPSSMGDTTAGTFSWFFDGSDVGLTTAAEKIDALDWAEDLLMLSTGGTLVVPKPFGGTLKAQDEDMVLFDPLQTGATTMGDLLPFFDGTVVPGMKGEDLVGLHYSGTGEIYAGITGSFNIGGVSGTGKDIIRLTHSGAPGGYDVALHWHGPDDGFNLLLGGFEMD